MNGPPPDRYPGVGGSQTTGLDLKPHPALTRATLQRLLRRTGRLTRLDVDCWRLPHDALTALTACPLEELSLNHVDRPCSDHDDRLFSTAAPAAAALRRLQISCFAPHITGTGIVCLAVSSLSSSRCTGNHVPRCEPRSDAEADQRQPLNVSHVGAVVG